MVSSRTLKTLFRYVLTGGTAAIVDLSVFAALHRMGVPIALAASASFCVAAVMNYTLTSIFVFKTPLSPKGFVLFFGVALLGMSINVGVTVAGSALTPFGPILAKVAGIGVAFLFNFWLNSTFVFKAQGVGASSPHSIASAARGIVQHVHRDTDGRVVADRHTDRAAGLAIAMGPHPREDFAMGALVELPRIGIGKTAAGPHGTDDVLG